MMTRLFRSFRALFVLGALLLGMEAMAAPLAPGAVFPEPRLTKAMRWTAEDGAVAPDMGRRAIVVGPQGA